MDFCRTIDYRVPLALLLEGIPACCCNTSDTSDRLEVPPVMLSTRSWNSSSLPILLVEWLEALSTDCPSNSVLPILLVEWLEALLADWMSNPVAVVPLEERAIPLTDSLNSSDIALLLVSVEVLSVPAHSDAAGCYCHGTFSSPLSVGGPVPLPLI